MESVIDLKKKNSQYLINCLMNHEASVSSNAAAEQVQYFFIMHFVIILHVRSQGNVFLYLFRNIFGNSWVNVYWDWSDVTWLTFYCQ